MRSLNVVLLKLIIQELIMFDPLSQKIASFFSFREDFAYLSYLEAKSHFDRIELKLDSSVDRLIGHTKNDLASLSPITSANSEAIDIALKDVVCELSEIQQKVETVTLQLNDIKHYTARTNALLEWGFTETISQHNAINQNLNELINISKTLNQAWAFEQFNVARNLLFNHGNVEEALVHINSAINGHENHSGLSDEARFYMLRGSIFLGNLDHINLGLVDLIKARSDFNHAARYAKEVDKVLHAKALGLVGWTHYCRGEMEEAAHWLGSAVVADKNQADIHFHYSKALIQTCRVEDGIKAFGEALRLNSEYGKRAAGDSDLMLHKELVIAEIECYRRELISDLKADFQNIALRSRLDNLHKTGEILCSAIEIQAYKKLDVLEKDLSNLTVEALEALRKRLLPQLLRIAQDELTNKYELLKSARMQRTENLLNKKSTKKGIEVGYTSLVLAPIISLIWVFYGLSDAWWHYLILLTVSLRIVSWAAIHVMEFPNNQNEIKNSQKESEEKRLLRPIYEAEKLADKLYKSEYEYLNKLLSTQARA